MPIRLFYRLCYRMASRRPKLSALTGSYQDFTDNYQQLEDLFWQLYPPLMVQAARCEL